MASTVNCDKVINYLFIAPTRGATVYKLALHRLNNVDEQWELLADVEQSHSSIWLSEGHIQSLECQLLAHLAELESIPFGLRRLETSFKATSSEVSASQAVFIAMEAQHSQYHALLDAGPQKLQYLKALLDDGGHSLDDHSLSLCSSHDMFGYDISPALDDLLQHLSDSVA